MKELLRKMFTGWIIREKSWVEGSTESGVLKMGGYRIDEYDAMTQACGGDSHEGTMLHLFSHWSNDIQDLSGYWGILLERDENNKLFIKEVDPEEWRANDKRRTEEWEKEHEGKFLEKPDFCSCEREGLYRDTQIADDGTVFCLRCSLNLEREGSVAEMQREAREEDLECERRERN